MPKIAGVNFNVVVFIKSPTLDAVIEGGFVDCEPTTFTDENVQPLIADMIKSANSMLGVTDFRLMTTEEIDQHKASSEGATPDGLININVSPTEAEAVAHA
jgi:hypothetical protein